MTRTIDGKEYLTFNEKIDLLVKLSYDLDVIKLKPKYRPNELEDDYNARVRQWYKECHEMVEQINLWYDEMEELGKKKYPKHRL